MPAPLTWGDVFEEVETLAKPSPATITGPTRGTAMKSNKALWVIAAALVVIAVGSVGLPFARGFNAAQVERQNIDTFNAVADSL